MSDAVEPIWKDMDEKATNKFIGGETHGILFSARFDAIVFPFERNSIGVRGDQTAVRDCDTVRISAEIGQNGFGPTEGWFGIDHPFYFAQWGEMCGESLRIRQPNQIAKESQFTCAV